MARSYVEEFERKFEKPVLNDLVVGFSGIDPQKKGDCGCDPSELTDEQLSIVNEEIQKKFNELKILIDSGNIDPDTPEPTPTPTPPPTPTPSLTNHEELEGLQGGQDGEHYHLSENDYDKVRSYPEYSTLASKLQHENLEGLLGGNSSGHYHLTSTERARVQNYPDYENLAENVDHEKLENLLGGNSDGHYHLTSTERNRIRSYPEYSELTGDINHEEINGLLGGEVNGHYHLTETERTKLQNYPEYSRLVLNISSEIDHEKLSNLLGGNEDGHYHMTEAEKQKLSLYPSYSNLSQAVNHERLSNLQGGTVNEHYHLTEAELKKLQAYPEYEDLDVSGTSNHEELSGLLGGETAGHFHLTGSQLTNVQKLIALFFPDGAIKPVIPEGITIYDPYGDLPSGTPPAWERVSFPDGYTGAENVHKMIAEAIPYHTGSVFGQKAGLLVLLNGQILTYEQRNSSTAAWITSSKTWTTYATTRETWENVIPSNASIADYYYIGSTSLSILFNNNTKNGIYIFYVYSGTNANGGYKIKSVSLSKINTTSWNSVCYSSLLKQYLYASADGWTVKITQTSFKDVTVVNVNGSHCGVRVNPGCAKWSTTQQVFCVSGPDGTATSSDGETWEVHAESPKDLIDLEYRENLGCFIARGETTKLFYASGDGETWQPVNKTPIPLETVAAVDFNPENEWYCAVGGTGRYAYFSKDLEHWIPTTISNSEVTAGSVIYMPSTGLYVLMPTSGNYYYTFAPANWTD